MKINIVFTGIKTIRKLCTLKQIIDTHMLLIRICHSEIRCFLLYSDKVGLNKTYVLTVNVLPSIKHR